MKTAFSISIMLVLVSLPSAALAAFGVVCRTNPPVDDVGELSYQKLTQDNATVSIAVVGPADVSTTSPSLDLNTPGVRTLKLTCAARGFGSIMLRFQSAFLDTSCSQFFHCDDAKKFGWIGAGRADRLVPQAEGALVAP